jgi:glycosyltransferase involved in cell wall biosynthesis
VIEALALGRRVVAYRGGGISEISDTLLRLGGAPAASRLALVDVGDVGALAGEIASAVHLWREEEAAATGGALAGDIVQGSRHRELQGDAKAVAELVRRTWDSEQMCRDELAFYRQLAYTPSPS